MKKLPKFILVCALVTTALGQNSNQDGNFKGQIRYEDNSPASYLRVELLSDGGMYRTYVNTDDRGRFAIQAPKAVIQYRIDMPGYRVLQGREDISTSGRADLLLTLRRIPGSSPQTAAAGLSPTTSARVLAITPDAKKEFEAGQQAMNASDLPAAAQHFQKAITLYPNYAEAYQLLGVTQLQTAQKADDLKAVEASEMKAIEIEKELPNAYYILGIARANMGNTPGAEEPLTTFISKDPNNPDGHFELAKTEFALNKFAEAELHARKAIELKEKNPGVEVVLAYSLLRQKKATEAKVAFQQYLQLDPNSPMKADVQKTIAMIDEHEKQEKQAK